MESGGNAVVNSIFEARLAQSGTAKPTNLADGPTRERFIRDKYERRKYFDPAGYANVGKSTITMQQSPASAGATGSEPYSSLSPSRGTPSDVARQRVANRQARMRTAHSQMEVTTQAAASTRPSVAPAPASAPVVFDLLDFGESTPAPVPQPSLPVNDPFALSPPPTTSTASATTDLFAFQQQTAVAPTQVSSQPSTSAFGFMKPASEQQPKPPASNDSILALFNTPPPQTSFSSGPVPGINHPNMMMASNGNNFHGGNTILPQQQTMMNQNMMGLQNIPQHQQNNPVMMQNIMMNPQFQSHMMGNAGIAPQMMGLMNNQQNTMAMNQQQQQQQQFMMGGAFHGNQNNGNYNSMMHGMQQLNMNTGNPTHVGTGMGMTMGTSGAHLNSDDSGFGTPMGGGVTTTKNDPFSSLGGMNAFR